MLHVLKVRIYPNSLQEIALAKSFGCSRFVWNFYLNKTNSQYKETGKGLTYCQMALDLTQFKKQSDFEWLQEPTAAVLQQSLINLQTAFKNFFEHRAKFPKFKSKYDKQSIRFPESCSIKGNGLKLPKLGIVKASLSKSIDGVLESFLRRGTLLRGTFRKIKSVTVSRVNASKLS